MFSGKTLVCKEKALQLDANNPTGKGVYFISLLGADSKGKLRPFQFVYDLITKWYDFGNSNVKFVDVRMLCDHYEKKTGTKLWTKMPLWSSSNVDVYKLALQFIEDHPNSHFIFDEVPFIRKKGNYNGY